MVKISAYVATSKPTLERGQLIDVSEASAAPSGFTTFRYSSDLILNLVAGTSNRVPVFNPAAPTAGDGLIDSSIEQGSGFISLNGDDLNIGAVAGEYVMRIDGGADFAIEAATKDITIQSVLQKVEIIANTEVELTSGNNVKSTIGTGSQFIYESPDTGATILARYTSDTGGTPVDVLRVFHNQKVLVNKSLSIGTTTDDTYFLFCNTAAAPIANKFFFSGNGAGGQIGGTVDQGLPGLTVDRGPSTGNVMLTLRNSLGNQCQIGQSGAAGFGLGALNANVQIRAVAGISTQVRKGLEVQMHEPSNAGLQNYGADIVNDALTLTTHLPNTGIRIDVSNHADGADYALIVRPAGGNIGFGTDTPDPDALVDMVDTTRAFFINEMTTAQRDTVAGGWGGGQARAMIYNNQTGKFQGWTGAAWEDFN